MTGINKTDPVEDLIVDGNCWLHFLYGALGIDGKDLGRGKRYYIDSLGNGGTLKLLSVEPNLGGGWQEGTEYSVPEWLSSLPMDPSAVASVYNPPKKMNPSKIATVAVDGAMDGDDQEEEEDEYTNEENKDYGIIVHAVFQGRPAAVVLMEHGIDDDKKAQEIDEMYRMFMQSELMQDVVEDHKEIPYTGKRVEGDEDGQIDRLVRKKDGSWLLIDYKSGGPSDVELDGKRKRYSGQMSAYSIAAKSIIGVEPKAYLYFVHNGKVVEM